MTEELFKCNVKEITELYDGDFADGWNENMLNQAFDSGRFFAFGKRENGRLIGFIGITLGLDFADVESVYTDKEYRRKGIAEKLILTALDFIEKNEINKTLLEVKETNAGAIALYEKLGFKKISVRKRYYADGSNAVIMVREK